eukprot:1160621-Pelagomonas_calceolata.AAC.5
MVLSSHNLGLALDKYVVNITRMLGHRQLGSPEQLTAKRLVDPVKADVHSEHQNLLHEQPGFYESVARRLAVTKGSLIERHAHNYQAVVRRPLAALASLARFEEAWRTGWAVMVCAAAVTLWGSLHALLCIE